MGIQFTASNLLPSQVHGDQFSLSKTHGNHFGPEQTAPEGQKSFGQLIFDSINEVNMDQQAAHDLSVQAVANPDSVEAHDVTIAMAKANMSLSITKSVMDKVVQAYKDITTLR